MFAQQSQQSGNYTARLPFGSTKKHEFKIKLIMCKRYREFLFQKVALGYVLHFVHNGSSRKKHQKHVFAQQKSVIRKLHGPASIWEHQKT